MNLEEKINADIKAAMLAKEKDKLEALRAVKSAILLAKTEKGNEAIAEEAEIKLLQKLVKQRKETAEIYKTQNRQDLADVELLQASFIEKYLPEQIDVTQLQEIIKNIIQQCGANSVKDMGKVMGLASKQLAGKADNKAISEIVKELLNK